MMKNLFKLLLATIVVSAPLLDASPAFAGGSGHSLRIGRFHRIGGWGRGYRAFDCPRACDRFVDRFDNCRGFRRGRFVYITIENKFYRIDRERYSGGVEPFDDTQGSGMKFDDKMQDSDDYDKDQQDSGDVYDQDQQDSDDVYGQDQQDSDDYGQDQQDSDDDYGRTDKGSNDDDGRTDKGSNDDYGRTDKGRDDRRPGQR